MESQKQEVLLTCAGEMADVEIEAVSEVEKIKRLSETQQ